MEKYAKLRETLPKNKKYEVKGNLLNENQVASVCNLLRKNGCIFEVAGLDMAMESSGDIEKHREGQAGAMTRHLTPEHTHELRANIEDLKNTLAGIAPQLYVQSTIASEVICRLLELIPTYFAQRCPIELDEFKWVIDGKDVNNVTTAEDWWSKTIAAMLH